MFFSKFLRRQSASLDSSLETTRTFLPPGISIRYQYKNHLPSTNPASFASQFSTVVIETIATGETLLNVKGGGKDNSLFRIEGESIADKDTVPFQYNIATPFLDFPSRNQIRFKVQYDYSGENCACPPPVSELTKPENTIALVDINLEFFDSTIITRLSGFGPVVTETLSLSIGPQGLTVTITADALSSLDVLPLSRYSILTNLDVILNNCFGFKLLTDYAFHQGALR